MGKNTEIRSYSAIRPTYNSLQMYKKGDVNVTISVRMSNTATRTFTIPPKSIICEIQPVTIEEQPKPEKR